jgi:hypothetical protein
MCILEGRKAPFFVIHEFEWTGMCITEIAPLDDGGFRFVVLRRKLHRRGEAGFLRQLSCVAFFILTPEVRIKI